MEARPETTTSGTVLGVFDVNLQGDPGGTTYLTSTQLQTSSEGVAREVALIVGALLFAQRQMRSVNDPARFAAVDDIAASCAAVRENRLVARTLGSNARSLATYRVELVANGSFRINVDQRLAGILHDSAGSLTTAGLAYELLATLAEPYRTFLREMLESSQNYWRERRPSAVESTWEWGIALGRLNQLVRQGAPPVAALEVCESCKALRPAGNACLRCGSPPSLAQTLRNTPALPTTPIQPAPVVPETRVVEPPVVTQQTLAPAPVNSAPVVVAPPPPAPPASLTTSQAEPERTILPAREAPSAAAVESAAVDAVPLASLPRRLGAWVLDIISGGVLAAIGGLGAMSILFATGSIAAADNPQAIFATFWVLFLGLYLCLGWIKGETLGMLLFRLRIIRRDGHAPLGLGRSILRGIGSLLLVAIAAFVVGVIAYLDLSLDFIRGIAATIMFVVGVVIGLYILWSGSGQRILTADGRQTLGDKIAGTLVVKR